MLIQRGENPAGDHAPVVGRPPRIMGLIVAMTAIAFVPRSLRICPASCSRCFLMAAFDGLISSLPLG